MTGSSPTLIHPPESPNHTLSDYEELVQSQGWTSWLKHIVLPYIRRTKETLVTSTSLSLEDRNTKVQVLRELELLLQMPYEKCGRIKPEFIKPKE